MRVRREAGGAQPPLGRTAVGPGPLPSLTCPRLVFIEHPLPAHPRAGVWHLAGLCAAALWSSLLVDTPGGGVGGGARDQGHCHKAPWTGACTAEAHALLVREEDV